MSKLSIIIPVLNEANAIAGILSHIDSDEKTEVIVVDGGSHDGTPELARKFTDKVFLSPVASRGVQMNLGAEQASGDVLLFLHADTVLPQQYFQVIDTALDSDEKWWGRFDVRLSGDHAMFRVIESLINLRSRLSGVATGDQAIFVRKSVFEDLRGFENIPLMEDVALSKALKKISRPICLRDKVITSSRRWEEKGILKTIFLMWKLRFAYFLGVHPERLARQYR